jgi:hypothetical protein
VNTVSKNEVYKELVYWSRHLLLSSAMSDEVRRKLEGAIIAADAANQTEQSSSEPTPVAGLPLDKPVHVVFHPSPAYRELLKQIREHIDTLHLVGIIHRDQFANLNAAVAISLMELDLGRSVTVSPPPEETRADQVARMKQQLSELEAGQIKLQKKLIEMGELPIEPVVVDAENSSLSPNLELVRAANTVVKTWDYAPHKLSDTEIEALRLALSADVVADTYTASVTDPQPATSNKWLFVIATDGGKTPVVFYDAAVYFGTGDLVEISRDAAFEWAVSTGRVSVVGPQDDPALLQFVSIVCGDGYNGVLQFPKGEPPYHFSGALHGVTVVSSTKTAPWEETMTETTPDAATEPGVSGVFGVGSSPGKAPQDVNQELLAVTKDLVQWFDSGSGDLGRTLHGYVERARDAVAVAEAQPMSQAEAAIVEWCEALREKMLQEDPPNGPFSRNAVYNFVVDRFGRAHNRLKELGRQLVVLRSLQQA